jgi:hypothetical protein
MRLGDSYSVSYIAIQFVTEAKIKSASKGGAMRHRCQHQQALLSKQGRHRRFPRYPIVHLPCPLSGFRHSRSESVLSSDQVYHSLKLRCKLAVFTDLLGCGWYDCGRLHFQILAFNSSNMSQREMQSTPNCAATSGIFTLLQFGSGGFSNVTTRPPNALACAINHRSAPPKKP